MTCTNDRPIRNAVLYITKDCTLCDLALDMLLLSHLTQSLLLNTVDIAEDDRLFELYGECIPVLEISGKVLNWPFSVNDVESLLEDL